MQIQIPRQFKFLASPARHKGAYGGRGSAKSHSFAGQLVLDAMQANVGNKPPELIGCFREVQNSIKDSVKALLDNKIDEYGFRPYFKSTDDAIVGAHSRFIFKGLHGTANINSVKSTEGITKAWIEEAQAVSQTSIETIIPTVRAPGSELWWSWNPNLPTDPVDKLLRGDNPPPNSVVREVNYYDNPFFKDTSLYIDMEYDKRRDLDKYRHIWLGKYKTNSEARVFKNWRIEEFEAPPKTIFYQGGDWGFSVDPSVLVRCFIIDKRLYIDYEAYQVGCEIDDLPKLFAGKEGAEAEEKLKWHAGHQNKYPGVPDAKRWMITADSARPETISFMKRKGFNIQPALKGKGSVEDGIAWLKNYDIIVHPRCKHVIDELSFYSWKVDKLTNQITAILMDEKNHTIDSLRYAIEAVRRGLETWKRLAK